MDGSRLPLDRLSKRDEQATPEPPAKHKSRALTRFSEAELKQMQREFSERFKQLFPDMNNTDIARRLKTTDVTLIAYMEGKGFPNYEMLAQIHRVTGVSIDWLMFGAGAKFPVAEEDFSEEESERIINLAKGRGLTPQELIRRLTLAGLEFLKKLNK